MSENFILQIYQDSRTVFRLKDIAVLTDETDLRHLSNKLNYYVRREALLNPRKGVYAKPGYNKEELACSIFTPCYISLEYVLQKEGVIFQYDTAISCVSYLSRITEADQQIFRYRKIKDEILFNQAGIRITDTISIASPERALLDIVYLNGPVYFDNLTSLKRNEIERLLPIYNSKALKKNILTLFAEYEHQ